MASRGSGNYYGSSELDIGCNQTSVATELPSLTPSAGASWPYLIKVYECDATGSKGALICVLDPQIDWGG